MVQRALPGTRLQRVACTIVAALSAFAHNANAWGSDGHRIVAAVAWQQLSQDGKGHLQALLDLEPGATLQSISNWADDTKAPSTAKWHYVNIEAGCHYEAARDCPDGACVVEAIERQARALRDSNTPAERLKALKYLVHLVGDAHQPLHAGMAADRGGNLYQVRAYGRGTNLHAIWDSGLIEHWASGVQDLTASTLKMLPAVRGGETPRQWAEESCRIVAQTWFYPAGHKLDDRYVELAKPAVRERLALAGHRLAALLEEAVRRR